MQITVEDTRKLIYVYVRKFNGKIVSTFPDVKCRIYYDETDNWIGLEIINEFVDGEKFKLPPIKNTMINLSCEKIKEDNDNIFLIFNSEKRVNHCLEESCNLDFNDEGFFGVELILDHPIGELEVIKSLLKR